MNVVMIPTKIIFIDSSDNIYDNAEFLTNENMWDKDLKELSAGKKAWLERLEEVLFIMQELEPCDSRNWMHNLWNGEPVEFSFHDTSKCQVTLMYKGLFGIKVEARDI